MKSKRGLIENRKKSYHIPSPSPERRVQAQKFEPWKFDDPIKARNNILQSFGY
jgi:hypothetical protein